MKLTKKICLMISLALFLLFVTVLAVSAADTVQTSAHGYRVTKSGTNYYYQYLEDAIADVPAGGTVTMLKNTAETLPTLRVDRTYTINGAGHSMTITPGTTEKVVDKSGYVATVDQAAIHIYEGHVTLKNATFLLASGTSTDASIYLQNPDRKVSSVSLTLDNVIMEFASTYGIWLHQEATVTIKGAGTRISGGTTNMIRMQGGANASRVTIEDGVISGKKMLVEMKGNGGSFRVTGGRLVPTQTLLTISVSNINVSFEVLDSVIDLTAHSGVLFSFKSGTSVASDAIKRCELVVAQEKVMPDLTGVDAATCALAIKSSLGNVPVSEKLDIGSYDDVRDLIERHVATIMPGVDVSAFASVSVNGNKNWSPLMLQDGALVTVTGGTYRMDGAPLFVVYGGALYIKGGYFETSGTNVRLIECEGNAKLVIEGGSFHSDGSAICCAPATAPDLQISGGLFVLGKSAVALIETSEASFTPLLEGGTVLRLAARTAIFEDMPVDNVSYHVRYGGKLYSVWTKSGATNEQLNVSSKDPLYLGASVLVGKSDEGSGIRFLTVLSEEVIAALKLRSGVMRFGTLIAPLDYVTAAGEFTVEALEKLSVTGEKYAKVEAKNSIRDLDADGIPESYSAALVRLKEKNYARLFAAISYVEIDGVMYYGSFDSTDQARSIRDIARKALVASFYQDDAEKEKLMCYAGFSQPNATPLTLSWQVGMITSASHALPEKILAIKGYLYSEPILLENPGDTLTFMDAQGKAINGGIYAISRWRESEGTWVLQDYMPNFAGDDAALVYPMDGATAFVYVATEANEYVRICYYADDEGELAPNVYLSASNDRGTAERSGREPVVDADFAIGKVALSDCEIVVPNSYTVSEWRFAIFLQEVLYERTNCNLPIVKESATAASGKIMIGSLAAEPTYSERHQYISRVVGNVWEISAESFYGYEAALTYIENTLFSAAITKLHLDDAHIVTGNGASNATNPLEKQGEVRMMYHNIWNSGDGNAAQRAEMLLELYAEYMPDVLGLQEYSPAMRKAGMDAGLAALGYAEVPTDPTAKYYGSEKQTRTPIFYNKETVELLDAGYLCLALTDYGAYPELLGSYTESAVQVKAIGDRSKAVTWGIFRMKATGHVFLAGSVHLWWEGDAVSDVARMIQMRAMREALTAAAEKYVEEQGLWNMMPVFIGGDYNSRSADRTSYRSMSEGVTPFTNLNDLVPKEDRLTKTSSLTYPTYDATRDIWIKCGPSSLSHAYALDHIFLENSALEQVTVKYIGMLEEYYSYASDHLAIFADLDFSDDTPTTD